MWLANEKGLMIVSPRLLKDVGDHAKNYHERYVRPSLLFTANQLSRCKKLLIKDFVDKLDPLTHSNFLSTINSVSIPAFAIYRFQMFMVSFFYPP